MDVRVACVTFTLTLLLMLSCCAHISQGQAYHFSNGWFPGRKRSVLDPQSSLMYSTGTSDTETGSTRPASSSSASLASAAKLLSSFSSSSASLSASCEIRPQIQQLIKDLLQMEVLRMATECRPTQEADSRRASIDQAIKAQELAKWIERLRNYHDNES